MGGRLDGKVAIVSGAGSIGPGLGNGKAVACLFAQDGAQILALDLNMAAAEETCRLIEKEGGIAEPLATDVTDEEQVAAAVDRCIQVFGGIDVLHNNVGIFDAGTLEETKLATWQRVMGINLESVFLTCKAVIPHMISRKGGTIINISSISGFYYLGSPYLAYNTSKGAIVALTRNLAAHYARDGIRANCILPGMIDTPMAKNAVIKMSGKRESELDFDAIGEARNAKIPMGRVGSAWDVARAALFLASDDSAYITGTELVVDGGLSCTSLPRN
jgi:NAD(P)-dependent dehydrogenase (short-subunit alcohol dehydrogenase family)